MQESVADTYFALSELGIFERINIEVDGSDEVSMINTPDKHISFSEVIGRDTAHKVIDKPPSWFGQTCMKENGLL